MAFWILPVVIFILVAGFVGLWMWTVFLETARPASVRFILHGLLFAISCGEVFIWYRGFFKWFVILPALFASFWGPFDAILRYPVVHDMDSFFTLKIILLVAGKTMLLVCGFHNLGKNAGLFLLCLFLCVWCIPLLYVMALPIGDTRMMYAKNDCRDMDILRKIYHVFCVPGDNNEIRLEVYENLRNLRDAVVQIAARVVPGIGPFLVKHNLISARSLRKPAGREI